MGRFATKNDLMFLKDHWLPSREMNTVSPLYVCVFASVDSTNHKLENLRKFQKAKLNLPHVEHNIQSKQMRRYVGITSCGLYAYTTPFYIRDFSICGFGICGERVPEPILRIPRDD